MAAKYVCSSENNLAHGTNLIWWISDDGDQEMILPLDQVTEVRANWVSHELSLLCAPGGPVTFDFRAWATQDPNDDWNGGMAMIVLRDHILDRLGWLHPPKPVEPPRGKEPS